MLCILTGFMVTRKLYLLQQYRLTDRMLCILSYSYLVTRDQYDIYIPEVHRQRRSVSCFDN